MLLRHAAGVLGVTGAGKSTFVTAILGRAVLSRSNEICTGAITEIEHVGEGPGGAARGEHFVVTFLTAEEKDYFVAEGARCGSPRHRGQHCHFGVWGGLRVGGGTEGGGRWAQAGGARMLPARRREEAAGDGGEVGRRGVRRQGRGGRGVRAPEGRAGGAAHGDAADEGGDRALASGAARGGKQHRLVSADLAGVAGCLSAYLSAGPHESWCLCCALRGRCCVGYPASQENLDTDPFVSAVGGNRLPELVRKVTLKLQENILRYVTLVDTPGLRDPDPKRRRVALDAITAMDGWIYLVAAGKAETGVTSDLAEIREEGHNLHGVICISKVNLLMDPTASKTLDELASQQRAEFQRYSAMPITYDSAMARAQFALIRETQEGSEERFVLLRDILDQSYGFGFIRRLVPALRDRSFSDPLKQVSIIIHSQ